MVCQNGCRYVAYLDDFGDKRGTSNRGTCTGNTLPLLAHMRREPPHDNIAFLYLPYIFTDNILDLYNEDTPKLPDQAIDFIDCLFDF